MDETTARRSAPERPCRQGHHYRPRLTEDCLALVRASHRATNSETGQPRFRSRRVRRLRLRPRLRLDRAHRVRAVTRTKAGESADGRMVSGPQPGNWNGPGTHGRLSDIGVARPASGPAHRYRHPDCCRHGLAHHGNGNLNTTVATWHSGRHGPIHASADAGSRRDVRVRA